MNSTKATTRQPINRHRQATSDKRQDKSKYYPRLTTYKQQNLARGPTASRYVSEASIAPHRPFSGRCGNFLISDASPYNAAKAPLSLAAEDRQTLTIVATALKCPAKCSRPNINQDQPNPTKHLLNFPWRWGVGVWVALSNHVRLVSMRSENDTARQCRTTQPQIMRSSQSYQKLLADQMQLVKQALAVRYEIPVPTH